MSISGEELNVDNDRFLSVTELSGDEVSAEQVDRIQTRYLWAGTYCKDKDIVEVACGTGQGLGYLAKVGKSVVGGDISPKMVEAAQSHYQGRVEVKVMNAEHLPFTAESKDVVILFEALYYLKNPEVFLDEVHRVLRPGGVLLVTTANKDLYDFNPSPYSHQYWGVEELTHKLENRAFEPEFFGHINTQKVSTRQKIFRPIKRIATTFNLIPDTMAGKKLLKSIVFGRLVQMPAEIQPEGLPLENLAPLEPGHPDRAHKVILCAAQKASFN